jgi:hypothetical protein
LVAKALVVGFQLILHADAVHSLGREGKTGSGAQRFTVEPFGDLFGAVIIQELIDARHDGRVDASQIRS